MIARVGAGPGDLGYPTQRGAELTTAAAAWRGTLGECTRELSDMSIVLIRSLDPMPSQIEPAPQRP